MHCEVTSLCPVSLFLSFKDTTRPRKSHEKEGLEYHFVSKQAFEADLHHSRCVGLTVRRALGGPGWCSAGPCGSAFGKAGDQGEEWW